MEISREQSAELVPHPYYPSKYIHSTCILAHILAATKSLLKRNLNGMKTAVFLATF